MTDPAPAVRLNAAYALGQRRDGRALPQLHHLAEHDDGEVQGIGTVRAFAIQAIRDITP